ncbi:hypothetical protein SISSUDRAFT_1070091 [Sistotremastrum suecicum HHB10207 ss-3]|uniref:pH-response regulator protein palC n=1 Tax=Sistotremastrum suecicum HHB10207 ss-3 TaxID=1314776 RepID=A0A166FKR7_9AGAM|nr:hypothetical protein SISSUDRAFT_1070091 [Sistotremastrum suecicum HHB10207 ss-3]
MYLYDLPTTGAISFAEFLVDDDKKYTSQIAQATQARADLRALLKETKRSEDGERDYIKVVKTVNDYLPYLYGIINRVADGDLKLQSEPVFSWRTTLSSSHILSSQNPRLLFPTLLSELIFSLLTNAFALSNAALSIVASLGIYERERHISDAERKTKDERLNSAVNLLCQASGIFAHLSKLEPVKEMDHRPPDVRPEVLSALSKMALAEAQTLAIRKLMSKSAYDSTLSPGPPLPKSHPSPTLIAKLFLEITSSVSSARSLAKTPGAIPSSSSGSGSSSLLKFKLKDKDKEKDRVSSSSSSSGEVSQDLRNYLAEMTTFSSALSHKWLGVDAGEQSRAGEAVGFLSWAKEELEGLGGIKLKDIGKEKSLKNKGKKERLLEELYSVGVFLQGYKKENDTLHFQPVPTLSELQALTPSGRSALAAIKYEPPQPAFESSRLLEAEDDT